VSKILTDMSMCPPRISQDWTGKTLKLAMQIAN